MSDYSELRRLAEGAAPIDIDLYGDRHFGGAYGSAQLEKNQCSFIAAANPAAVLALIEENSRLRKLPTCWTEVIEQSQENDQQLDQILVLLNERDQLKSEVEALRKDASRLDRLEMECEAYGTHIHEGNRWVVDGPFATVREAIDAAMSQDSAQ